MKDKVEIEYLTPNQYKKHEPELLTIFNENFFKNGGMLYSDDFLTNSDSIVIAKMNQSVVAYMAITSNIEKELDREHEIYTEEPEIKDCLVIKHLVIKKEYRYLNIATQLIENLKEYSKQNKIKNLYLWTTPDNKVALKFYEKMGFYKMGDYRPANGTFQGLDKFHSIMMVYKI